MQAKTIIFGSLIVLLAFVFQAVAQESAEGDPESEDQRYDIVLTIDKQKSEQLRRTGFLKASLPEKYHNRVDSIVLKHPNSFLAKHLELEESVDTRNKTLTLRLDQTVVDHLEFQPVRIKIYESNFIAVLLSYQPNRPMIEHSPSSPSPADSPLVFLRLNNGKGLSGHLKNGTSLTLKSQFGEIQLPYKTLAGLALHADDENRAVMVLDNRDTVSGTFEVEKLVLKTRWGDKTFLTSDVKSITRTSDTEMKPPNQSETDRWIVQSVNQPDPVPEPEPSKN